MGNPLSSLDVTVFRNLYALTFLDLDNTTLTALPVGLFDGLYKLEELYLCNNQLSDLKNGTFRELYTLRILDLSNNSIEHLDPYLFADMPKLKEIGLSKNKLTALDDRLFAAQLGLLVLHLSNNRLVSFDLQAMSYARTLFFLDLDGNRLQSVRIAPNLEFLTVDDNQLSTLQLPDSDYYRMTTLSIQNNSFSSLESTYRFDRLVNLNVTLNRLAAIDLALIAEQFPRLNVFNASLAGIESLGSLATSHRHKALQHLDLSNNTLTDSEIRKIDQFPKLESFEYGGNRIRK
uniref:Leucine rich immune protein (Coil-less) n=1 Tax=Anopheles maculatus TaxID=74869 RepID=A0A182SBI1_9DIPT